MSNGLYEFSKYSWWKFARDLISKKQTGVKLVSHRNKCSVVFILYTHTHTHTHVHAHTQTHTHMLLDFLCLDSTALNLRALGLLCAALHACTDTSALGKMSSQNWLSQLFQISFTDTHNYECRKPKTRTVRNEAFGEKKITIKQIKTHVHKRLKWTLFIQD